MNKELKSEFENLQQEELRVLRLEEPIYRFFSYTHLPIALQEISEPFKILADAVLLSSEKNIERSECLRKLLEAKDCAIRAKLFKGSL